MINTASVFDQGIPTVFTSNITHFNKEALGATLFFSYHTLESDLNPLPTKQLRHSLGLIITKDINYYK